MHVNKVLSWLSIIPIIIMSWQSVAEDASIEITELIENERIAGRVLDIDDPQNYAVLVYVQTDKWYIHPYAGQGEGLSWASINQSGEWSIETVRRKFTARGLAVLVVRKEKADKAPDVLDDVLSIKNIIAQHIYRRGEANEDIWHNKL